MPGSPTGRSTAKRRGPRIDYRRRKHISSGPRVSNMETRTSLNPRKPALSNDVSALRDAITGKLTYALGTKPEAAAKQDWDTATSLAVRDRVIDIWMRSSRHATQQRKKRVYYLSIEFLIGKALTDTLVNLGLLQQAREALASFDV